MTSARGVLNDVWRALAGEPGLIDTVRFEGEANLPSCFAVSDLAAGTMAAAALAASEYAGTRSVTVDRRLASLWFGWSFQPIGWKAPANRNDVTGDYQASDGWIRLHCNAPHHRQAALAVLGVGPEHVADAVRHRAAGEVETAIVTAGGCAAAMRTMAAWAAHPQGSVVASEPLVWRRETVCAAVAKRFHPARPLAGMRVLDLTRVFAGPVCTRVLAGLGAEVLRIDPPEWDEAGVAPEMTLGKRCARLDARTLEGRDRLARLLAGADVLVHGYRPGALELLGFGETERNRLCPGLIDVSLDAYGWSGPWSGRRGFDSLVQMSSGIADEGMRRYGAARPTPLPVQALDHAAGYIMAAACLRGLVERRQGSRCTARTSLARVAALLAPTAGEPHGTLGGPAPADFADAIEHTEWGPMRRLRSPWTLGGTPLRWDRPACALGSAEPSWAG